MRLKLRQYREFLKSCRTHLGADKRLFIGFVVASVGGALTEAIGISLFVPLLDSVSDKQHFGNIPLQAQLSDAFTHLSPELRIRIIALLMLVVVAVRSEAIRRKQSSIAAHWGRLDGQSGQRLVELVRSLLPHVVAASHLNPAPQRVSKQVPR